MCICLVIDLSSWDDLELNTFPDKLGEGLAQYKKTKADDEFTFVQCSVQLIF